MKQLLFILLLSPLAIIAQEKGVHFEHTLSWQQVKEKAKKENKYIFMDCFTTWCGPCKYMSNTVFPQEQMGDFFNEKFVNVKVQMDKTDGDADYVKSWYEDAEKIGKEYSIKAYPTFLYFSPDGELVHRVVGGGEAAEFIAKSSDALNPDKQYYTLLKKADQEGTSNPQIYRTLAEKARNAYDMESGQRYALKYIETQKDLFTKENLSFLAPFVTSSKSKYFDVFQKQGSKIDKVMGKGYAAKIVDGIIMREEIYPQLRKGGNPDWKALQTAVAKKYPGFGAEPIAKTKVMFYQQQKDWPNFQQAVTAYMASYGSQASPMDLNQFAWTVFENCKDKSCIEQALEWSKRSLKDKEDPMFMDTYANLLYKLGKKEDAIAMQQKAANMLSGDKQKQFLETLDKMKKGEKTWKD